VEPGAISGDHFHDGTIWNTLILIISIVLENTSSADSIVSESNCRFRGADDDFCRSRHVATV
jgi:hypothetical protein